MNIELLEWGTYIHDYGRLVVQCSPSSYFGRSSKGYSWIFWDDFEQSPLAVDGKMMLRSMMKFDTRLSQSVFKMAPGDSFYIYWEDGVCAKARVVEQGKQMDCQEFLAIFLPRVRDEVTRCMK